MPISASLAALMTLGVGPAFNASSPSAVSSPAANAYVSTMIFANSSRVGSGSVSVDLPVELQQDVLTLTEPLPTRDELAKIIVDTYAFAAGDETAEGLEALKAGPTPSVIKAASDALIGIPSFPALQSSAMCLNMVTGELDIPELWSRKKEIVSQRQGLSYYNGLLKLADMYGCEAIKLFSKRFMAGRKRPGLILRLDEMEKQFRGHDTDSSGSTGKLLGAQKLEETNLQIRPQIETFSQHIDREIRPQIGQITAHLDQLASSVARADGEISRGMTERAALGLAISRLETGEQFDRQAIHDISSRLFGGREPVKDGETSVGIVIPTCDRPDGLRRALNSIAAQSRKPNAVIIVVNDGGADISAVAEEFSGRLPISTIKTAVAYSGSSAARNLALDALDTALIAFLDDDNLRGHAGLNGRRPSLKQIPRSIFLYGAQLRDAERSTTSKSWFFVPFDFEALQKGNFIDLNQVVHRSSDIRFDPNLRRLVDWDYVLRLIGPDPKDNCSGGRRLLHLFGFSRRSDHGCALAARPRSKYCPP